MKIETSEDHSIVLTEVFNPVVLKTSEGNEMSVCMRDDTFEFSVKSINSDLRRHFRVSNIGTPNIQLTRSVQDPIPNLDIRFTGISSDWLCGTDEKLLKENMRRRNDK